MTYFKKPIIALIFSCFLSLAACSYSYFESVVSNEENSSSTSECEHDYVWKSVDPTCLSEGRIYQQCTKCNNIINETSVDKLDHVLSEIPRVESTCAQHGHQAYYTCSECQHAFEDGAGLATINDVNKWLANEGQLPLSSHDYHWVVDLEPSISAAGTKHQECSYCGNKANEGTVIPQLTHIHNMNIVPSQDSTCANYGTKQYYQCEICDHLFEDVDGYLEIDDLDSWKGTNGRIAKKDHDLSWVIDEVATCSSTGTKHQLCSMCGQTFNENTTIPIDEHKHTSLSHVDGVPATCQAAGVKEHYHCDGCSKDFDLDQHTELDDVAIAKLKHTPEWIIDVEATATSTGSKHQECQICHQRLSEDYVIPVLDHTHVLNVTIGTAATCQTAGLKDYYKCNTCNKYFEDSAGQIEIPDIDSWKSGDGVIPVISHNYGDWNNKENATCTEDGALGHYHCDMCNQDFDINHNVLASTIIPKGHKYGNWISEVPSTCTVHGTAGHYHCSLCSKNFDSNYNELTSLSLELIDHSYGSLIPGTSNNCLVAGTVDHYTCSVCGAYFDKNKNPISSISTGLGSHHYISTVHQPTETSQGYTSHVCDICHDEYIDSYVQPLGYTLSSGNYKLNLRDSGDGYSLYLKNKSDNILYSADNPITVYNRTSYASSAPQTISSLSSTYDTQLNGKYTSVTKNNTNLVANGTITTANGSIYSIKDTFSVVSSTFTMKREVTVTKAATNDYGFETAFNLVSARGSTTSNSKIFMPGISIANSSTYGGSFITSSAKELYSVREVSLPSTMASLFENNNKETFMLQHVKPDNSSYGTPISSIYGGGTHGTIHSGIRYGSLGYTTNASKVLGMQYTYPARERRFTYSGVTFENKVCYRYTPTVKDETQSYTLGIFACGSTDFPTSEIDSYSAAYNFDNPSVPNININTIYEQNIDMLSALTKTIGTSETATGVPYSVNIVSPDINEGYNFASGFIGQQIGIGYQLFKYGHENNNSKIKNSQGRAMLDFWASNKITRGGSYFNYYKWCASNNSDGGAAASDGRYFLRYITDGSEAMCDAYRYAKKVCNETNTAWLTSAKQNADILCTKQNSDGSFYRCYNETGGLYDNSGAGTGNASATKESTLVPVRYLYRCYELTGTAKYKTAADKALDYGIANLYPTGMYCGGATDLTNYPDKEGACFALYAYLVGYQYATDTVKKANYLKAAKNAAIQVMSYTYTYDFAIPNYSVNSFDNLFNPFVNGGVKGVSKISINQTHVDNFSAYMYFDMAKLYAYSEQSIYLEFAKLLQKATKSLSDYDGRIGYVYKAMTLEATSVTNFALNAHNNVYYPEYGSNACTNWLPWSSVANIEPITNAQLAFGNKDISNLSSTSFSTLRNQLTAFGAGGKI